ncbi:MAG TPA: YfhO family protein, partial [Acidimicrobiia bacterium]|nr:YfhO family protein [Acidimicrobiia bacterium]
MIAGALFGALVAILFAPVLFEGRTWASAADSQPRSYPWRGFEPNPDAAPRRLFQTDLGTYYYPYDVFVRTSIRRDRQLPLWDPLTLGGHPFYADNQTMVTYPPRLGLSAAVSPSRAHDLYLMLHVWAAGLTMFALMAYLGVRFSAALLSGLAWALSSYTAAWLALENYAAVLALLPLVVLFIRRAHDRRSYTDVVWGALALGGLYIGSSPELALPAFLLAFVYAASLAATRVARQWREAGAFGRLRDAAQPVAIVGLAGAVAAVSIIPFLELRDRVGIGRVDLSPAQNRQLFPVTADDLLHVFVSSRDGLYARVTFAGTVVALLAIVGCFRRRPGAGLGRGLLIVMALVLIVPPVTWLAVTIVPPLRSLVGIGRTEFLFVFGVAVLGGLGLDSVLDRLAAWKDRPEPVRRLVPGFVAAGCVVVTAVQLVSYMRAINPPFARPGEVLPSTPAVDALRAVVGDGPGTGRVLPVTRRVPPPRHHHTTRVPLPGATAVALGLPVAGGYEGQTPGDTVMLWRVVGGESPAQVRANRRYGAFFPYFTSLTRLELLPRVGISAVLVAPELERYPEWQPDALAARGLSPVYRGPDGIVYAVAASPGRAFVVDDPRWVPDNRAALDDLLTTGVEATGAVTLAGPAHPAVVTGEQPRVQGVRWEKDRPDEVSLRVNSDRGGWLVLLDSWDPGWDATVRGHPAAIERANFNFRAVRVPAGRSTVTFHYRPTSVIVGAAVSIV